MYTYRYAGILLCRCRNIKKQNQQFIIFAVKKQNKLFILCVVLLRMPAGNPSGSGGPRTGLLVCHLREVPPHLVL